MPKAPASSSSSLRSHSTRRRTLLAACVLGLLAAGTTAWVQAGQFFRWKDGRGITHYGDRSPEPDSAAREVTALPFRAEPGAAVRLRLVQESGGGGDSYQAWADNSLAGPVQVRLGFAHSRNVRGEPALPARATIDANGSALVARIISINPGDEGDFALNIEAVPGNPSARPRDVEYKFPLGTRVLRVEQGYGGRYSHSDAQNHYAVDFAAPIGTDVLAARDGVVMQVETNFDQAGLSLEKYGGRANFVRIAHDDGTMAVYAHLRERGVLVRTGQHVRAGQLIGYSGNTGFTSGPHLHFALQVNRDMQLVSIPFRMFGPGGILRFAEDLGGDNQGKTRSTQRAMPAHLGSSQLTHD